MTFPRLHRIFARVTRLRYERYLPWAVLAASISCLVATGPACRAQAASSDASAVSRETLSLDQGWRFHLGDIPLTDFKANADEAQGGAKGASAWGAAAPKYDDKAWRIFDLPHDWVVEQPFDQRAVKNQGYSTDAHTKPNGIMSGDELIRYLANCAVRNMVILINVAPDRHGSIPDKQQKSLRDLGTWLAKTGDAFYATRGGPWQPLDRQYGYTFKNKTIYVHLLKDYKADAFTMPPMGNWRVVSASDVFTGKSVPFASGQGQPIILSDLDRTSSPVDTIVAVTFDRDVKEIWNQ
jgi:hypothetical protein